MFASTRRFLFFTLLLGGLIAMVPTVAIPHGTYTVAEGDSLWTITDRFSVQPSRWPEILKANAGLQEIERGGKTIVLISPGQKILIPDSIAPTPAGHAPAPRAQKPGQTGFKERGNTEIFGAQKGLRTWETAIALLAGLAGMAGFAALLAFFRPWNWFSGSGGMEPVSREGARNAEKAAEALRRQAAAEVSESPWGQTANIAGSPFGARFQGPKLVKLQRVRIFGPVGVKDAFGAKHRRVLLGEKAWEGEFDDGSKQYALEACATRFTWAVVSDFCRGQKQYL